MLPWLLLNVTVVGLLIWQSIRDYLEKQKMNETIDHLLETHRQLALTIKAENATEAQVAIERDLMAHRQPTPPIDEPVEPEIPKHLQVGGRRFSIFGMDPDQEREFMENVVGEVTNAAPVKS
jgi:hypothetical protein